jgi:hypothetical protein
MEILVTEKPIDAETLGALAEAWHGSLVKGAVDLVRGVVALGGDWHMDANVRLIEQGSSQENVWGFNLYPEEKGAAALEYVSLINIRPRQGNRSMEVLSEEVRHEMREKIAKIVPFLSL